MLFFVLLRSLSVLMVVVQLVVARRLQRLRAKACVKISSKNAWTKVRVEPRVSRALVAVSQLAKLTTDPRPILPLCMVLMTRLNRNSSLSDSRHSSLLLCVNHRVAA